MRKSVGVVTALLFAGGLMAATPAAASQILYELRAKVGGTYASGGVTKSFYDPTAYLRAYGDTAQVGTALGPAQPSGSAPNFNTVRLTYASGKFGPVSGAIAQDYFGGDYQVFAITNSNFTGMVGVGAATEVSGGRLQDGGFFYSPALKGWDGVSSLGLTPVTSTEVEGPGVDIAFKNGVLVDHTSLTDMTLSARLLTGATPGDALLPSAPSPSGYGYAFDVAAGQTVFIDPEVAIGYDYVLGAGSPLITRAVFPILAGSAYQVFSLADLSTALPATFLPDPAGLAVDFTTLGFAGGINGFRLLGIDPGAGLDPTAAEGFTTGLTFATAGPVSITQIPITTSVPEPATWAMLILGFFAIGGAIRARSRSTAPVAA